MAGNLSRPGPKRHGRHVLSCRHLQYTVGSQPAGGVCPATGNALTPLASAASRQPQVHTLARMPKRRLDSVSASLSREGEQHRMITVRAVPPSESCSTRVSLESLRGVGGRQALTEWQGHAGGQQV